MNIPRMIFSAVFLEGRQVQPFIMITLKIWLFLLNFREKNDKDFFQNFTKLGFISKTGPLVIFCNFQPKFKYNSAFNNDLFD
jgi:hypothetical protein